MEKSKVKQIEKADEGVKKAIKELRICIKLLSYKHNLKK